jgi:hypothetical protein
MAGRKGGRGIRGLGKAHIPKAKSIKTSSKKLSKLAAVQPRLGSTLPMGGQPNPMGY